MVWKSDFFSGFMRFVRVPPYENWAFWTNFYFSWENGEFFWGQTCCTLFHTKNEEKSQKISTCIRIHTRVYAITWWWGQICPPGAYRGKLLECLTLVWKREGLKHSSSNPQVSWSSNTASPECWRWGWLGFFFNHCVLLYLGLKVFMLFLL